MTAPIWEQVEVREWVKAGRCGSNGRQEALFDIILWNSCFFFAVGTFKIHGEDIQTSLDAALNAGYRAIGKSTGEGWCYAKKVHKDSVIVLPN